MSIFRNYFFNILMTVSGILFPMITFPYISRVLMPEYIGKITFAQSVVFYFITLSLLGIPIYGVRELSKLKNNKDEFKRVLTELLVIGIIGSILSFILVFILINFNLKLKLISNILYIFSIQVIFSFLNLDYLFIVLEKHKRRAIRTLFLRIISIILMFVFIKSYNDYKIYVLILVIPDILIRILDFISVREYISIRIKMNLKRHIKSLLILFVSSLSISLYISLDSTMLGLFKGDSAVGLYASASKMTKILIPLIVALETVIGPELIYNIKKNKRNKIFKQIDMFLDFNFILGVQFIFILFILSKNVILLFSGERFIDADLAFKIMLPIIFFIPVGTFMSGKILISNNLEKLSLKLNFIGMVLNGSLNYLLINRYGIAGAAFATVLTEGVMCGLKCLKVKELYSEYKIFTKDRLTYIFIGFFITIFLIKIENLVRNDNYFLNILFMGGLYILIYLVILLILKDKIISDIIKKIKGEKKK